MLEQLSKCGSAPIVSCATVIGEDIIFLGSWLGDSLLARYTRHQRIEDTGAPGQDKDQWNAKEDADELDIDALEEDQVEFIVSSVIGLDSTLTSCTGSKAISYHSHNLMCPNHQLFGVDVTEGLISEVDYSLQVGDVLQCVGPIRDMVAGAPPEAEGSTQHTRYRRH